MKKYALLLVVFAAIQSYAQDTLYYDKDNKPTDDLNLADYYKILIVDETDTNRVTVFSNNINGIPISEKRYSNYSKSILDRTYKEWHKNGILKEEIGYKENKYHGWLKTYWPNGTLKREDVFQLDNFIRGKCFDSNGVEIPHFDYKVIGNFPGGVEELYDFLSNEIKYPKKMQEQGLEGRVVVRFIVNRDGSLSDFEVIENSDPLFDAEALRVVKKMPKWTPTVIDGELIKLQYTLPIMFKLL